MLNIVTSYPCMQFQGKLISKTWKNTKKPSSELDFGSFGPNLDPKNFFNDEFYLN